MMVLKCSASYVAKVVHFEYESHFCYSSSSPSPSSSSSSEVLLEQLRSVLSQFSAVFASVNDKVSNQQFKSWKKQLETHMKRSIYQWELVNSHYEYNWTHSIYPIRVTRLLRNSQRCPSTAPHSSLLQPLLLISKIVLLISGYALVPSWRICSWAASERSNWTMESSYVLSGQNLKVQIYNTWYHLLQLLEELG